VDGLLSGDESQSLSPQDELVITQRQLIRLANEKITRLEWDLEKLRKEMGKGD